MGGSGKDLIVGGRGNDTLEADEGQRPSTAFGLANRRGARPHHLPLVLGVSAATYPPGQEVKLLDGVISAARSNTLADRRGSLPSGTRRLPEFMGQKPSHLV